MDEASVAEAWFPGEDSRAEALRAGLRSVQLPAGRKVFCRGEVCRDYLVVLHGSIRVQMFSPGGREVTLYRVSDRQSCVLTTSCLIGQELYPAEGVAECDTRVLLMPLELFERSLEVSADFRRFVFANQGKRLADLIRRVEEVACGRLDARLARHLVDRCANQAGSVCATHQQLASELGTAREVVSRQLKVFEKKGWIALHRGAIEVVQPQALSRACASPGSGGAGSQGAPRSEKASHRSVTRAAALEGGAGTGRIRLCSE